MLYFTTHVTENKMQQYYYATGFPCSGEQRSHNIMTYMYMCIAGGSCKPTRLEAVQADTMTPGQQALRVARQRRSNFTKWHTRC